MSDRATRVGLALSGGGFRAAAFHLGVLKRLEELDVLRQVEALSTVSGGSITGALYALRCSQTGGPAGSYTVDCLIDEMVPFLARNLRARALFGTPTRALRALWSVVSTKVSRIGLMVQELDHQLFHGATLNQLPDWIVVNATNLRTGKGWKFYSDRAGDYLAGATDKTSYIKVSEAVAASAAYPGLTDSYAFETRWEDLRGDLLSEERWERPAQDRPGKVSRWRERFGKASGSVTFPLVDGGLYDNEGVNGLRGRRVTHAIISAVAPPESTSLSGFTPRRYIRIVEVIHDRLGAATRQLAHEMTHGMHPHDVRTAALEISDELRRLVVAEATAPEARDALEAIAQRVAKLAAVGMPPRGHQFRASAQVLLHRTELAKNAYRETNQGGLDAPPECRGLSDALVAELARVRTDLDALEEPIIELLMAQGYFLTDLYVKLAMPELLANCGPVPAATAARSTSQGWYTDPFKPSWQRACRAIADAETNHEDSKRMLQAAAARRGILGRVPNSRKRIIYFANLMVAAASALAAIGLAGWLLFAVTRCLS